MNYNSLTEDKKEQMSALVPHDNGDIEYLQGYRESYVRDAVRMLKKNLGYSLDGLFLRIAYRNIDRAFPAFKETKP